MRKSSKFNLPRWNEPAKGLNTKYTEAVSHWNIAGSPRSGPLAELKCRARAAFRHEMKLLSENEDEVHSQIMLSKLQRGECNDFWKKIKAHKPKKESLPFIGEDFLGDKYAFLWKDHFSPIANFVGSTDNLDRVMDAFGAVPMSNDVINGRGCTILYYARGAQGILPMRVGGATSQFDLPSLAPLP